MSKWSEHVKRYAKKHKMSYREASMDSRCKEAYRKKKKRMSPRRMKMHGRGRSGEAGGGARDYSEKRSTIGKRKVADYIEQKEIELESYSDIFYMTLGKIIEKEQELGTGNYYQLERDEVECSGLIDQANSILDEILRAGFLFPRLLDEYDTVLDNIKQCIEDFKRKYIVLKEEIDRPCPQNCQNGINCHECGDNPNHKCRLECELVRGSYDSDYFPEDPEDLVLLEELVQLADV